MPSIMSIVLIKQPLLYLATKTLEFHSHPLAGLVRTWDDKLPKCILEAQPEELADQAMRHAHENNVLKTHMLVQDMHRAQIFLEAQERAVLKLESLIRTIRSVKEKNR